MILKPPTLFDLGVIQPAGLGPDPIKGAPANGPLRPDGASCKTMPLESQPRMQDPACDAVGGIETQAPVRSAGRNKQRHRAGEVQALPRTESFG